MWRVESERRFRQPAVQSVSRKIGLLSALTLTIATLLNAAALFGFIQSSTAIETSSRLANLGFAQRDSLLALVDEETGVRGYVASGDLHFLDIYDSGRRQFAYDAAYLNAADGGTASLRGLMPATLAIAGQLDGYFGKQILTVRDGNRARAVARLASGKALFDRYRALDDRTQRRVFGALHAARARAAETVRIAIAFSIVTIVLFTVIGLRFMFLVQRGAGIELQAYRDPLTGLANRRAFMAKLQDRIADTSRRGRPFAVAVLDLDGFKTVNDTFGHAAGDTVLRITAARLLSEVRTHDTVARIGGDEFALVLDELEHQSEVSSIVRRLTAIVEKPIQADGAETVTVGISIGFGYFPSDGHDADSLLAIADAAMYAFKDSRQHASRSGTPV